jgi:hypothetical protein
MIAVVYPMSATMGSLKLRGQRNLNSALVKGITSAVEVTYWQASSNITTMHLSTRKTDVSLVGFVGGCVVSDLRIVYRHSFLPNHEPTFQLFILPWTLSVRSWLPDLSG